MSPKRCRRNDPSHHHPKFGNIQWSVVSSSIFVVTSERLPHDIWKLSYGYDHGTAWLVVRRLGSCVWLSPCFTSSEETNLHIQYPSPTSRRFCWSTSQILPWRWLWYPCQHFRTKHDSKSPGTDGKFSADQQWPDVCLSCILQKSEEELWSTNPVGCWAWGKQALLQSSYVF